ncbi:hypothetical protein ACH5RR_007876 [Cinchona calisaya]|uniref:COP1-interacting protein 7 n=1 Tax=Cinchona calisaya TaxID=153742 RepID=A0ABD3A9Z8_9GENT
MKSDAPLDYAVFQLSPKRSRCELVVSSGRNTEKLASGLVKPFVAHLRAAEEQVAMSVRSIKLEVQRRQNAEMWFTKGTLERFVRFVSTPEILELANTFDAEMSQLESARRIYQQGTGDQLSGAGGAVSGVTAAADATKKELLRAIDVRFLAVQQDLTTACARATAAGFNPDTVSDLQLFADCFGAQRLNEACSKFILLCKRRPELILTWKARGDDRAIRSSYGSDMSIDEEPTSPGNLHMWSHQPLRHEERYSTSQQQEEEDASQKHQHPNLAPFKPSFPLRQSRESSVELEETSKQNDPGAEKEKKQESISDPPPDQAQFIAASQPSRRLSVQDRINLFENKQTENSGSKPAMGKLVEIKRQPSDVSSSASAAAVDKAVLRRWSGASDMSIDLSGEKKDVDSSLCIPSSSVSYSKSEDWKDTRNSGKLEFRSLPARVDDSAVSGRDEVVHVRQLIISPDKSGEASDGGKSGSTVRPIGGDAWNYQTNGKTRSRSFLNRAEDNSLNDQANSEPKFRFLPSSKAEEGGSDNQPKFKGFEKRDELVRTKGRVASEAQVAGQDRGTSEVQYGPFAGKSSDTESAVNPYQSGHVELLNQKEVVVSRDESFSQTQVRDPQRSAGDSALRGGGSGSRIREAFAAQHKGVKGKTSFSQPRHESFVETEDIQMASAENLSCGTAIQFEDTGPQMLKFEKQIAASEQIKKIQDRRNASGPVYGSNKALFSSKVTTGNQEAFDSFSTPPPEHVQRVRQSKGNQELNDELKMKANALEKLFAEHKLRAPGDQSNPARRSRPVDKPGEPPAKPYKKPSAYTASAHLSDDSPLTQPAESAKNLAKFNDVPLAIMVGCHNDNDHVSKNFSELNFADGSRGKFYERYMQKRDAKLSEDWSSNRAEKEAKLKAMQDSLERSRSEMNAKFSGSADRQDSVFSARRRAERLRSFNMRSVTRREQHQLDFGQSDDDEDASDFPEQKYYGEDGSFTEASVTDGLAKSVHSKKSLPTKSLSSSTPRTSAAPVPRSATRASNISGRRKMQSENPLAQSVPNFSDLRKENTKPSSAASRSTRPQLRNHTRSKSTSEDTLLVKEEKSHRSHSLRKSLADPVEFRETSPLNSEGICLATDKFDKDGIEQSPYGKYSKTSESKPFLNKVSGRDFGTRATIAFQKKIASDNINDEDEFDDLAFEEEDLVDLVKGEAEEGSENVATKHHGEPEMDQETQKENFGSENDGVRSFAQMDSSLVAELAAAVPTSFHASENAQDSPGESPISWNSRSHNPFSYSHEMSDIDASVDSPVGSPASWNSHSLSQTETDATRMRKKWGAAQKPMLVSNSSHNQSRKDMTRGFKRLLKFGRRNRGTETLVDWISATTSEGDDDTEEGRDPANRLSEDLRKSRMGSLQGHPSDDGFNESEFFNEQVQSLRSSIPAPPANFKLKEDHLSGSSIKVPRSFFSLSSFRSKGSESKPG